LYVVRLGVASPLENLINVAAVFLFGFIGICTFYVVGRKHGLKEPDYEVRQENLDKLRKAIRKVMNVYVPIWLVIVAIHVWLLLMGKN
ncbi:MAG: hypothetical protein ACRD5H_15160, partial [Nitrososphaerales archaeon]